MAKSTITFPIVEGTKIRRNAETGIEIEKIGTGAFSWMVTIPGRLANGGLFVDTLAEAREYAIREVGYCRLLIAEAWDEAHEVAVEQAPAPVAAPVEVDELAHARRQFPSVFAMLDNKHVPASSVPDRVELIEFGTAEPSGYVYMLSARPGHTVCLPSMPKMEIAKRSHGRKGASGFVPQGWAVSVDGREIDRCRTKRAARVRLDEWLVKHLAETGV